MKLNPFRYTQVSPQRFSNFDSDAKLLISVGLIRTESEKFWLVNC